jgi:antitoxin (DNA-binding transcriptional repressor) of toxin-antitoxin stability system
MQAVKIRELLHNFSHYLNEVKEGDSITIFERDDPVADIVPHNNNIRFPGWKRVVKRRKIGGESFSKTTEKIRKFN